MDLADDGGAVVAEANRRSLMEPTPGSTTPCPAQVLVHALEDHAAQVMLVLDATGTLRWIGPVVQRTLGYQADDLAGTSVLALLHPDDVAQVRRCYHRLLAAPEAPVSLQLRVRHRDGSWRVMAVSGTNLLAAPAVRGILVIAADLTERHQIEAALRESEERFRRLADATFEAIILHDQGIILEVNQAFATLFGCSPAAAIGQSVLAFAAPESHAVIRQHIAAQSEEPYEAVGLRADGSRFVGELRGRMCPY